MKRKAQTIILAMTCGLLLSACNIFENSDTPNASDKDGTSSSNQESAYEYTAADVTYATKAGDLIATNWISNTTRKYYKAYDGFCAIAIANIDNSFGPVLVGEDAVQVCYYTDNDSSVVGASGSFVYDDNTYFYSKAERFLPGSIDTNKKWDDYVSKFTTLEEVARDLASKATFQKVDESLKNVFIFTELNDGTLSVKAGPYAQGKEIIEIPAEHDGKKVSTITANGFKGLTTLKEVKLPTGSKIKTIGDSAFKGCLNLRYAFIPESVTTIGKDAFANCSDELMIYCEATKAPSGYYTNVYGGNWYGSADKYYLGTTGYGENEEYRYGIKIDGTIIISKYIGSNTSVIVPDEIEGKTISVFGRDSFGGKNRITDITLPNGLTQINDYALQGCSLITEIKIPSKVHTIGGSAFKGCSNLRYAYIPESVTTIGENAFANCSDELMIYCEANKAPSGYYTNVYGGDWYGSADKVWYSMIQYAENEEYRYGVMNDGTAIICKYLGSDADVVVPRRINNTLVTSIGRYAFYGKNRITSVTLPDSVKTIGKYAFSECALLTGIKIPSSVETIGDSAFRKCSNLRFAVIPKSVTTVGENAFYDCSAELMIYCEVSKAPSGYYTNVYGGDWYGSADKVWYEAIDCGETDDYRYGIKIDETISISRYTGSETTVVIPDEINGARITSIAVYAFKGKSKITSVVFPSGLSAVRNNAFEGCVQLTNVDFGNVKGNFELGEYVFKDTGLASLSLYKTLTKIGAYCFQGTTFTTITFYGSKSEWDKIEKASNWKSGSKITTLQIGGSHDSYSL